MKVSPHCYAITGLSFVPPWSVNAGFVVGKETTLVIDTGANLLAAQTIHGYALSARPENMLVVVNTERHLDHICGNGYFQAKGIEIYGHYAIARSQEEFIASKDELNALIPNPVRRALHEEDVFFIGTTIVNPTRPVQDELQLDLGAITAHVLLTPGHTMTNLSVYIPSDGVLFVGDCIVSAYLPNLEEGTVEQWSTWLDSLKKLEMLQPHIVVPGHGQVLQGSKIAKEIDRIRAVLLKAVGTGRAPTLS